MNVTYRVVGLEGPAFSRTSNNLFNFAVVVFDGDKPLVATGFAACRQNAERSARQARFQGHAAASMSARVMPVMPVLSASAKAAAALHTRTVACLTNPHELAALHSSFEAIYLQRVSGELLDAKLRLLAYDFQLAYASVRTEYFEWCLPEVAATSPLADPEWCSNEHKLCRFAANAGRIFWCGAPTADEMLCK